MSNRDDFSQSVKKSLAERAGYQCSFPNCDNVTIGPSDETSMSSSNTGVACHICAAASGPGARRWDPLMTPDQRTSIENGIWMCYTHSKLIDTDEALFTPVILRHWRKIAERRAQIIHAHGRSFPQHATLFEDLGLASSLLNLSGLGTENERVGDLIQSSCMPIIWGKQVSEAVRDFAIEIVRNSFFHGNATTICINISATALTITADGKPFDPTILPSLGSKTGGVMATNELITHFASRVLLNYTFSPTMNLTTIQLVHNAQEVADLTPCSISLSRELSKYYESKIETHDFCNIVYIIYPPFTSFSDIRMVSPSVNELMSRQHRQVVCVLTCASDQAINWLKEICPGAHVVNFPR